MDGKVALITGSTSGIGLGIARRLAEKGCSVVLTGLGDESFIEDLLKEFRSSYSGRFDFVDGDLRSQESVASLCQAVTAIYSDGIDILMNNAGIQHVARIEDYPMELWDTMVSTQLTAPFQLIRHFLPYMKKKDSRRMHNYFNLNSFTGKDETVIPYAKSLDPEETPIIGVFYGFKLFDNLILFLRKGWGRFINTSSQMGMVSEIGKVPYSTVKSGMIGMAKGVALEAAEFGVTCNAICPGFVETQIVVRQVEAIAEREGIADYATARAKMVENVPTKKLVTIDEVAGVVLYLCSDEAASMTGTTLTINGGYTAR